MWSKVTISEIEIDNPCDDGCQDGGAVFEEWSDMSDCLECTVTAASDTHCIIETHLQRSCCCSTGVEYFTHAGSTSAVTFAKSLSFNSDTSAPCRALNTSIRHAWASPLLPSSAGSVVCFTKYDCWFKLLVSNDEQEDCIAWVVAEVWWLRFAAWLDPLVTPKLSLVVSWPDWPRCSIYSLVVDIDCRLVIDTETNRLAFISPQGQP